MKPSRIIVALDHDDPRAARSLVRAIGGAGRRYKIGSALFTRAGPPFVRELAREGHAIFLDLKFHDTPTTVAGAVRAAAELGVELMTLHAAGGSAMLAAARAAADAEAGSRPRLLAVTVLTSLGAADWVRVAGPGRPLAEAVLELGRLAREAGIDGVVCAAGEAAALRSALGEEALVVVPGIRPAWSTSDHAGQTRTATPAEAIAAGASDLVVGRAITAADDPAAALRRVEAELAS